MKPHRARGCGRAFTLMEMVISVALMALILGAGYACLRSGVLSQKVVDARSEAFQNARVAIELMSSDLRGACRLSESFEFLGLDREVGGAEADNVDFGTRRHAPRAQGEADFRETSYFLRRNPKSGLLDLLRRRDTTPDSEPLAGGTEEVIAQSVKGLRLQYYDGYQWHDEWGDPQGKRKGQPDLRGRANLTGLPEAVRITLSVRVGPTEAASKSTPNVNQDENPPFVVQTVARLNAPAGGAVRSASATPGSAASRTSAGGVP